MSVQEQMPASASDETLVVPPAAPASAHPQPHALTAEQVALLQQRRNLAWAAQHAYFERSAILAKMNYWIGVPVVIVTALAGSAIVVNQTGDKPIPFWVGLITVTAAVLASLQTFLRFGERSAFSAVAGARYSRLRRRIEDCLAFPPEGLVARLAEIQKMEDDAAEQSPPLGERRWLRWQAFAELPTPPTRSERWKMTLTPSRTKQASGKHER
jgi:hypothetical protein